MSILTRSDFDGIGMLKCGDGGHTVVGTRQVPCADTERMLPEVVEAIKAVG